MKKNNSLKDRLKKSYESKDRGAGTRPSAMNWRLVEDIKFYKPKEGKNKIDIIPYIVKTKNDPLAHSGDIKIKELGTKDAQSYMLDLWIHSNIGPTQAQIICNKENFNKPCPICEQRQQFYNDGKKDEASALKAKRQCFYNVRDVKNNPDEIQIWSISHFLFEKELIEEAKASADDGGIVDFVDIDEGKSINFRAAETESVINGKSVKFLEYKSFSFSEREDPLDDSWIKKAVSFDELMILNTYDEAKKILFGEEDEEDDEDEKPVKKVSKKAVVEDDDDEELFEDDEEETDDESDEDNDEDEEEEESEPVSKPAKVTIGKKNPEKILLPKCPSKHVFGKDCDKHPDDCDDCDLWSDCKKEQKKLKAK